MFLFDPPPAEVPSPDALSRAVADARLLYRNARLPWGIREGLDVCLWEIGSGKPIPPHFVEYTSDVRLLIRMLKDRRQ